MAIFLASTAIGLLIAKLALSGFVIDWSSFIVVVILFALLQALLAPALGQAADRKAPVLSGGVGLATTFIALVAVTLVSSGVTITGLNTWIFATLIIWIATMFAMFLLPMIFLKNKVNDRREASGKA